MAYETREAVLEDAADIARVHIRSWRSAYQGLVNQDHLDSLDLEQRADMWTAILATPNEGARVVVEVDESVVGFLIGARESSSTEGAAEIYSIYLDPDHWRRGMGAILLSEGVAALRRITTTPIILWVLDGNEQAMRFYESQGWQLDGANRDSTIGEQAVPHLRYRLE